MTKIKIGKESDLQELSDKKFTVLFKAVNVERWRRLKESPVLKAPTRRMDLAYVNWNDARDLLSLPGSPAKNASHHASHLWSKLHSFAAINVFKLEVCCSKCNLVQGQLDNDDSWHHHEYGCPFDKVFTAKMPAFTERSLIFQEEEIKAESSAAFPQWLIDDALFIIEQLKRKQR